MLGCTWRNALTPAHASAFHGASTSSQYIQERAGGEARRGAACYDGSTFPPTPTYLPTETEVSAALGASGTRVRTPCPWPKTGIRASSSLIIWSKNLRSCSEYNDAARPLSYLFPFLSPSMSVGYTSWRHCSRSVDSRRPLGGRAPAHHDRTMNASYNAFCWYVQEPAAEILNAPDNGGTYPQSGTPVPCCSSETETVRARVRTQTHTRTRRTCTIYTYIQRCVVL